MYRQTAELTVKSAPIGDFRFRSRDAIGSIEGTQLRAEWYNEEHENKEVHRLHPPRVTCHKLETIQEFFCTWIENSKL